METMSLINHPSGGFLKGARHGMGGVVWIKKSLAGRELDGMSLINHPSGGFLEGDQSLDFPLRGPKPGFIPSFPTEHQQVFQISMAFGGLIRKFGGERSD